MAVSGPVTEAVMTALETEAGVWPEGVELYQPNKATILLSDAASCESVEAYCRFCKLPYELKCRQNAEFMSPTGNVPLLRVGKKLVGGLQEIFSYVNNKGFSVSADLDPEDRAEMKAYMSLVDRSLLPVELYMLWCKREWAVRSRHQYGSQYPVPLNFILSYRKQWSVWSQLRAFNWHLKKEGEVVEEFKKACQALAEKLGGCKYFIQDRPTEVDAMVFGHLHAILTRLQPDDTLVSIVQMHKNLQEFVMRISNEYFQTCVVS